jgi:hypothetical protein
MTHSKIYFNTDGDKPNAKQKKERKTDKDQNYPDQNFPIILSHKQNEKEYNTVTHRREKQDTQGNRPPQIGRNDPRNKHW